MLFEDAPKKPLPDIIEGESPTKRDGESFDEVEGEQRGEVAMPEAERTKDGKRLGNSQALPLVPPELNPARPTWIRDSSSVNRPRIVPDLSRLAHSSVSPVSLAVPQSHGDPSTPLSTNLAEERSRRGSRVSNVLHKDPVPRPAWNAGNAGNKPSIRRTGSVGTKYDHVPPRTISRLEFEFPQRRGSILSYDEERRRQREYNENSGLFDAEQADDDNEGIFEHEDAESQSEHESTENEDASDNKSSQGDSRMELGDHARATPPRDYPAHQRIVDSHASRKAANDAAYGDFIVSIGGQRPQEGYFDMPRHTSTSASGSYYQHSLRGRAGTHFRHSFSGRGFDSQPSNRECHRRATAESSEHPTSNRARYAVETDSYRQKKHEKVEYSSSVPSSPGAKALTRQITRFGQGDWRGKRFEFTQGPATRAANYKPLQYFSTIDESQDQLGYDRDSSLALAKPVEGLTVDSETEAAELESRTVAWYTSTQPPLEGYTEAEILGKSAGLQSQNDDLRVAFEAVCQDLANFQSAISVDAEKMNEYADALRERSSFPAGINGLRSQIIALVTCYCETMRSMSQEHTEFVNAKLRQEEESRLANKRSKEENAQAVKEASEKIKQQAQKIQELEVARQTLIKQSEQEQALALQAFKANDLQAQKIKQLEEALQAKQVSEALKKDPTIPWNAVYEQLQRNEVAKDQKIDHLTASVHGLLTTDFKNTELKNQLTRCRDTNKNLEDQLNHFRSTAQDWEADYKQQKQMLDQRDHAEDKETQTLRQELQDTILKYQSLMRQHGAPDALTIATLARKLEAQQSSLEEVTLRLDTVKKEKGAAYDEIARLMDVNTLLGKENEELRLGPLPSPRLFLDEETDTVRLGRRPPWESPEMRARREEKMRAFREEQLQKREEREKAEGTLEKVKEWKMGGLYPPKRRDWKGFARKSSWERWEGGKWLEEQLESGGYEVHDEVEKMVKARLFK
ncbi:hypothetical protein N0V90_006495 [Kalmusia sp. IMI 367209]|nr:hypothetical protein N0V90_006495 [Kalmusia sp. IMI 367209]